MGVILGLFGVFEVSDLFINLMVWLCWRFFGWVLFTGNRIEVFRVVFFFSGRNKSEGRGE